VTLPCFEVARANSGKDQRKLVAKRNATKNECDEGIVVVILFCTNSISGRSD